MYASIDPTNAAALALLGQVTCGFITQLEWSPDGGTLALAHGWGVWLWDEGFGGSPTRKLEGHSAPVEGMTFQPDGELLATASADTTVRLWSRTGEPLGVLREHTDAVSAVAFSPDGRLLASAGGDRRVLVTEAMTRTIVASLEGHTGEITSAVFAGSTLATGGWDKTLRLWDSAAWHERAVLSFEDWIRDLTASPDGRTIAAACKDGTVCLIDVMTAEVLRQFPAHERGADAVVFSPDGALLATGGRDNAVKLWAVAADADVPLVTLEAHRRPVLTLAFHPAGNLMASGSGDNSVRLWGIQAGESTSTP